MNSPGLRWNNNTGNTSEALGLCINTYVKSLCLLAVTGTSENRDPPLGKGSTEPSLCCSLGFTISFQLPQRFVWVLISLRRAALLSLTEHWHHDRPLPSPVVLPWQPSPATTAPVQRAEGTSQTRENHSGLTTVHPASENRHSFLAAHHSARTRQEHQGGKLLHILHQQSTEQGGFGIKSVCCLKTKQR